MEEAAVDFEVELKVRVSASLSHPASNIEHTDTLTQWPGNQIALVDDETHLEFSPRRKLTQLNFSQDPLATNRRGL